MTTTLQQHQGHIAEEEERTSRTTSWSAVYNRMRCNVHARLSLNWPPRLSCSRNLIYWLI